MTDIQVVFVDESLLVLDKPAGLLSVPGRGEDKQDCLSHRAQQHYPNALVVHRLDMSTSGLLVMARGLAVQRKLNDAFAERLIHKRYEAIVNGVIEATDGAWQRIDLPILLDWPNRPRRIIDAQQGKPSCTRWQLLATDPLHNTSRVALEPVTGRSHQLRVHLQAIGHAILGDMLYASPQVAELSGRLLLHACMLELTHPVHQQTIQFVSPAPF